MENRKDKEEPEGTVVKKEEIANSEPVESKMQPREAKVTRLEIPHYKHVLFKNILPWFQLFEEASEEVKLDDNWRRQNLINYMDEETTEYIITTQLYKLDYQKMKSHLISVLSRSRQEMEREFREVKLAEDGDLRENNGWSTVRPLTFNTQTTTHPFTSLV